jgi:hypothetical protein
VSSKWVGQASLPRAMEGRHLVCFPSPLGPVTALGCPDSPPCCRLGLVCARI